MFISVGNGIIMPGSISIKGSIHFVIMPFVKCIKLVLERKSVHPKCNLHNLYIQSGSPCSVNAKMLDRGLKVCKV